MTKNKENELIAQALKSANVSNEVNKVCRYILIERLRDAQMNDRQLRIALENMVNHTEFPVELEVESSGTHVSVRQPKNENSNKIGFILVLIVGAVLALFSVFVVRLLGVLLMVGSAALFYFKSTQSKAISSQPNSNWKADLIVKSTVGDISAKIESSYNSMQPLFEFNQLDGRYKYVLEWLQNLHSHSTDEKKDDVESLIRDLGYELVAYDDAYGDFFELCNANVVSIVTTKYAVRNTQTGKFVINGIAVLPMKE